MSGAPERSIGAIASGEAFMSSARGEAIGLAWPRYYTVVLLLFAAVFISYIDRTNISVAAIAMKDDLGWTETQKGVVLSAFFVGYLLLMAVTGALANRYGGWLVLGVAVLWWSAWTALTPPAAMMSLGALIAARIALGLGEAAVFPASMNMISRWVPPERRSRATALIISAISLGTVFALPATGWLVREFGWALPFYLFGAIGLVWYAAWHFLAHDDVAASSSVAPAQTAHRAIPWGQLLRLPAVWAIIVSHFASNWGLYVLLAWLPTYFKNTFGVSLASAGVLSAAPWLVNFIAANLAGAWADRMLRDGRGAGYVRKLMQTIALGGGAVFLLLLTQATTPQAAVLIMCCATGTSACAMSGFAPNCFDIAPKYADVIWGISNTFATLPGIVGIYVTGWLVDRTGTFGAPFVLTAGVSLFGAAFYLVFGSGRRQTE
jgi:MFS transporter, ACS family, solute carrier family 17 (sodium-dependent inorganic phosphate cotransporter), other